MPDDGLRARFDNVVASGISEAAASSEQRQSAEEVQPSAEKWYTASEAQKLFAPRLSSRTLTDLAAEMEGDFARVKSVMRRGKPTRALSATYLHEIAEAREIRFTGAQGISSSVEVGGSGTGISSAEVQQRRAEVSGKRRKSEVVSPAVVDVASAVQAAVEPLVASHARELESYAHQLDGKDATIKANEQRHASAMEAKDAELKRERESNREKDAEIARLQSMTGWERFLFWLGRR